MENVGDFFRKQRSEKGYSLKQVAEKTRISLLQLHALESGHLEKIPSETHARAFILGYAQFLELDPQEVWGQFREWVTGFYQMEEKPVRPENPRPKTRIKRPDLRRLAVGAGLGTAVVLAAWFLYPNVLPPVPDPVEMKPVSPVTTSLVGPEQEDQPDAELVKATVPPSVPEPDKMKSASPVTASLVGPGLEESPDAEVVKSTVPPSIPEPEPLPESLPSPGQELTLEIEAAEQGWVRARIDDVLIKEVLLRKGDKVRWMAREEFILSLGNAGGAMVIFNGEVLDPAGVRGQVVKDIVLSR